LIDVTVSIVNWNTREELRKCLRNVLNQQGVSVEVIVVDNASKDGSAEMVRAEFADKVLLICNSQNCGFGAAHNQAIKRALGRYIMLLNPDCTLENPSLINDLVAFMDQNVRIGIVGPKILNPDGSLQFSARRFPNMIAAMFRHTFFSRLFPNNKFVRDYLMSDWSHDETRDVDWLSGAAMLISKKMLNEIGYLDERFFMYCEDVDLCRRAHRAGWRVLYYPMCAVTHRIGASSDQNPVEMVKEHHKSMMRYYLKYDAHGPKLLLAPLVVIGLWLRYRSLAARARLGQNQR
jgi:GT2 family glycosyltransferase